MHARDLAGPYPTVSADDDALDAARLLVREQLPALLVRDRDDYPYAVVPSAHMIGAVTATAPLEHFIGGS
ncbi:CBS domain-containing protein [Streptomyces sp. HC44]|uniref:CBS domain-containing protein n=1 Tax=Streptomyces scabichelini TaxID=2711217 RepID=A0A6G4V0F7_9ACTN|nr:CBS domain-containing protein [Streptomyces scabichelini]NGO07522.1 CBS domain-containing protein [Streptomyces scabichelini]